MLVLILFANFIAVEERRKHRCFASTGQWPHSPIRWEQRYLILECKVWIFEDVVHEDDEFAQDGGERDFSGFACGA